jgi:hypothetical protein
MSDIQAPYYAQGKRRPRAHRVVGQRGARPTVELLRGRPQAPRCRRRRLVSSRGCATEGGAADRAPLQFKARRVTG